MERGAAIFSLFSGVGFLDLGFEQSGFDFEVVFFNEVCQPFSAAYKSARQHMGLKMPRWELPHDARLLLDDVSHRRELSGRIADSRREDRWTGLIGGPPCPDFAIGGKNRGLAGENGRLSATFMQIVREYKPDFFLFENVKGLWKTRRHRTFYDSEKRQMVNAGYLLTERLINSLAYGVPQNRERIILIGFRPETLPGYIAGSCNDHGELPAGSFPWLDFITYENSRLCHAVWPKRDPFAEDSSIEPPEGTIRELTVQYWFERNAVETHVNAPHCFRPRRGLERMKCIEEGDDSRKSFKRLHRWRYAPTACYGHNEVHLHPYKARRISVAEALSVQSLPQDFVLPSSMTLTDMFQAIGNGIPFEAAKGIARSVGSFLGVKECR